MVAAKMIDVVSGEIAAQTSYERQGPIDVLLDIAKVVGGRLAGTEIVMIEVEEPKVEEPEEEEVAEAPKVEPVARPKKERKPVEFKRFVVGASIAVLLAAMVNNVYEDPTAQDAYDSFWGDNVDLIGEDWDFNRLDAGIVVDAGVDIQIGAIVLNLEARYTLGLIPVLGDTDFTNGALSITGGAGFQF